MHQHRRALLCIDMTWGNTMADTIHSACWHGDLPSVRRFVEVDGVDVRQKDAYGNEPIHVACQGGFVHIVELLVQHGVDLEARAAFPGRRPIHCAAKEGQVETVQWLVRHGARLDAEDNIGNCPIHYAAGSGHLDLLEWMVVEKGIDIDAVDGGGCRPLHLALYQYDAKVVEWIVRYGADVNAVDPDGDPPIHELCQSGDLSLVELFEEHGCDLFATDGIGRSALHLTCLGGHLHVARWLVHRGLEINGRDSNHDLPLHCALRTCIRGHDELLRWLFENSDVHAPDHHGDRAIHFVCRDGNEELVRLLLGLHVDIHCTNAAGRTPIQEAARHGHHRIVAALIDSGSRDWDCVPDPCEGIEKTFLNVWLTTPNDLRHVYRRLSEDKKRSIRELLFCLHRTHRWLSKRRIMTIVHTFIAEQ